MPESKDKADPDNDEAEAIRQTAYFLWEQDGKPAGRAEHYWSLARERHLRERAYDLWLEEGSPPDKADEHWQRARGKPPDAVE